VYIAGGLGGAAIRPQGEEGYRTPLFFDTLTAPILLNTLRERSGHPPPGGPKRAACLEQALWQTRRIAARLTAVKTGKLKTF
jgi:hypothetical protein